MVLHDNRNNSLLPRSRKIEERYALRAKRKSEKIHETVGWNGRGTERKEHRIAHLSSPSELHTDSVGGQETEAAAGEKDISGFSRVIKAAADSGHAGNDAIFAGVDIGLLPFSLS